MGWLKHLGGVTVEIVFARCKRRARQNSPKGIIMSESDGSVLSGVLRTCSTCGVSRPEAEFRFRDREHQQRHSQCNACFAAYQRERRGDRRRLQLQGYVDELASELDGATSQGARSRTEAVLKIMLEKFGGLEAFAMNWFDFLKLASLSGKHHLIQRSFEAMLRMMELADREDKESQSQAATSQLTHEQLQEFLENQLARMLFQQPDIAVVVLEKFGWQCEPPVEPLSPVALSAASTDLQPQFQRLFAAP